MAGTDQATGIVLCMRGRAAGDTDSERHSVGEQDVAAGTVWVSVGARRVRFATAEYSPNCPERAVSFVFKIVLASRQEWKTTPRISSVKL